MPLVGKGSPVRIRALALKRPANRHFWKLVPRPKFKACPMLSAPARVPSGHVFRVDRKRGPSWYAKFRLPDGRQVQRRIGPAWTERGRAPDGLLHQAHRRRTDV